MWLDSVFGQHGDRRTKPLRSLTISTGSYNRSCCLFIEPKEEDTTMAWQRDTHHGIDNIRLMHGNGDETFALGVLDPGRESIRLALEAPDYKRPRTTNEARAIARVCHYASFAVPIAVTQMLGPQNVPKCQVRRAYSKAPWSESKEEAIRFGRLRDQYFRLQEHDPGCMHGEIAHGVDSAIARRNGIPVEGFLITLRDPEDVLAELAVRTTERDNLQQQLTNVQQQLVVAAQPLAQQVAAQTQNLQDQ